MPTCVESTPLPPSCAGGGETPLACSALASFFGSPCTPAPPPSFPPSLGEGPPSPPAPPFLSAPTPPFPTAPPLITAFRNMPACGTVTRTCERHVRRTRPQRQSWDRRRPLLYRTALLTPSRLDGLACFLRHDLALVQRVGLVHHIHKLSLVRLAGRMWGGERVGGTHGEVSLSARGDHRLPSAWTRERTEGQDKEAGPASGQGVKKTAREWVSE